MENKKAIIILPLRCILFALSYLLLSLVTRKSFTDLSQYWSVVSSICNFITILILIWICKVENIKYKNLIKYEKGKTKIYEVIIAVIFTLIIGMGGMYLSGFLVYGKLPYMSIMMIQPIPLWLAVLNVFILPLTTTLAEDGLYLGYSLNRIYNKDFTMLMPAFFYALQHSFIPFLIDGRFILYRFLSFLPLTVIFSIWYKKKLNPLPIMVGHFVINLATVGWILATSASPDIYEMIKAF